MLMPPPPENKCLIFDATANFIPWDLSVTSLSEQVFELNLAGFNFSSPETTITIRKVGDSDPASSNDGLNCMNVRSPYKAKPWNCTDPALAQPIRASGCGTSGSKPLCPDASIAAGFGFYVLNVYSGAYDGLFTIPAASAGGVLNEVHCCGCAAHIFARRALPMLSV